MNIKNKTGRKNKTNQNLIIPSLDYFSTDQLLSNNPDMRQITARTKFKSEYLNSGKIKEIGQYQNDMGRPTKVYAVVPVSDKIIESAKNDGIVLKHEYIVEKVTDINSVKSTNNSFNVTQKSNKTVFSI